jgi:hypothetical protein
MHTRHRSRRGPGSETVCPDQRVYDALTDLSAYALTMDIECHRVEDQLANLAQDGSPAGEVQALLRLRSDLAEELNAFRGAIEAFHQFLLPTTAS